MTTTRWSYLVQSISWRVGISSRKIVVPPNKTMWTARHIYSNLIHQIFYLFLTGFQQRVKVILLLYAIPIWAISRDRRCVCQWEMEMDFLRSVGGFQIAILETLTVTIETFLFSNPTTHSSKGKKRKITSSRRSLCSSCGSRRSCGSRKICGSRKSCGSRSVEWGGAVVSQ